MRPNQCHHPQPPALVPDQPYQDNASLNKEDTNHATHPLPLGAGVQRERVCGTINLKKNVCATTLPHNHTSITPLSYLHLYLLACDELYEPYNEMNHIKDLLYKDSFSEDSNNNKPKLSYQAYQPMHEVHVVEDLLSYIGNFLVPNFWQHIRNA